MGNRRHNELSREERIKKVTEELREKNKEAIERRRREGFGIPDDKKTDAQKKEYEKKYRKIYGTNKGSGFWGKIDSWSSSVLEKSQEDAAKRISDSKCPNCKKNVSMSAYTCPSCGHPLRFSGTRAGAGCLGWTIIFVAVPIILLMLLLSQ